MFTRQDLDSSSTLSDSSTNHSEHGDQYGQEQQQNVRIPLYDYGIRSNYQIYDPCYRQPSTPSQQNLPYSSSYPDPWNQSMSQPYENHETERKCRKKRVPFTPYQLSILVERFEQSDTLALDERNWLAQIVNLTPRQIKHWYSNRRAKIRNGKKQREQKEGEKNQDRSQLTTSDSPTSPCRTKPLRLRSQF